MPDSKSRFRPWLLVALLWVVALLNYLDRQTVFSLFPLLQRDLGATGAELGLVSTVFLWVYGLLSPFAGYLADRFGRVRVILFSLLVWSAVTWATAHVRTVPELLVARALMGVSEACYLPAALALIVEAHEERSRSLAAGLHQSGLYTGLVLAGVWGGWMGEQYGWRSSFNVLGCVGIAYFVVLWLALPREGRPAVAAVEAPAFCASMRTLFGLPGFVLLTLAFAAFAVANWIVYTWLPLYLYERFGMSLTKAGFSASVYIQVASYVGVVAGGFVADRWIVKNPRARMLTLAAGLMAGAPFLFLIGLTSTELPLILALVTFGLARGVSYSNTMPALSQLAPAHLRATGYGIFNMVGCIVAGVAAALAGVLKTHVGLSAAFEVAGVVLLAGGLMVLRIRV
ncbi:MAG: MFS transporter, partial [Acidobacteria bacterium]|nr:MFS transporter [Acidobacteriota bacterium]